MFSKSQHVRAWMCLMFDFDSPGYSTMGFGNTNLNKWNNVIKTTKHLRKAPLGLARCQHSL